MIQANIIFLSILKENQETIPEKEGEYKRWLKGLYEITADKMNNTPTVCKKSMYILNLIKKILEV